MDNTVHFGDGVYDTIMAEINRKMEETLKIVINVLGDSISDSVKHLLENIFENLPEIIDQLHNNPETEQKIATLWSEYLYEKGVIPKGYNGLSDNLLISNFHQQGYLDGLYTGYILAMMALVDNNAPKDKILAVRDYIRPNLIGHHYDDRDEFISQYKCEKYNWIEKTQVF